MQELQTIIKLAIQRKELPLLIMGINTYSKANIGHDPLDAHSILKQIYQLYGNVPGIEYTIEQAIKNVINRKNAESFYIGLKYQLSIYDFEQSGLASFKLPTNAFASLLHQSYAVNKHNFSKMYDIPRIGVKCSSGKGVSVPDNLLHKVDKLNTFASHVYNKTLY